MKSTVNQSITVPLEQIESIVLKDSLWIPNVIFSNITGFHVLDAIWTKKRSIPWLRIGFVHRGMTLS